MMYAFEIPGPPVPKGRPRFGKGRTYTPKETEIAEVAVAWEAKKAGVRMTDGAVALLIEATFEPPKSWSKARREEAMNFAPHTSRPDADNLAKLIKDALNGVAYADDAQVADLTIRKFYGPTAKTRVAITPVEAAAWAEGLE